MISRTRIVVVDDHELFRESIVSLIAQEPDLEVVGQAADGFEALRCVRDVKPDLVLMDIHMPICDGLEATRLIRAHDPGARILILSISQEDEHLFAALQAGASGYVQKDSSKVVFLRGIRQVLAGETALSSRQTTSVVRAFREVMNQIEYRTPVESETSITEREHEVLELLVAGLSNEEISMQLSIGVCTVKTHVSKLLQKLGATNRRDAARHAVQRGLVTPRH